MPDLELAMNRMRTPTVLFPRDRNPSPAVRLCLLAVSALHFAAIPYLLILPLRWLTVPAVAVLGLLLLWAPRRLSAFLGAAYSLAGLAFLGLALRSWGDRHGEDLLFGAAAVGFCVPALFLGFAWNGLRKLPQPLENTAAVPVFHFPAALGALAVAGIAAATLLILLRMHAPAPSRQPRPAPAGDTAFVPPLALPGPDVPEAEAGTGATLFERERVRLGERVAEGYTKMIEDTAAEATWSGNVLGGRHYFLPGTFDERESPFTLGCRKALLRRFAVDLFRFARVETVEVSQRRYAYSRPLAGDTLLPSLGCREIPMDARYYALRVRPDGRSAAWEPIVPGYTVSLNAEDNPVPGYPRIVLGLHAAGERWPSGDLLLATRDSVAPAPLPYFELAPRDTFVHDLGSRVNLAGFDSTRFRSCWIENMGGEFDQGDGPFSRIVQASLYCKTRSGSVLPVGTSEHWGLAVPPGAGIGTVRMADFDGDGFPDILVETSFQGTRIYFLGKDRVRDSLLVQPDPVSRQGC